MCVELKVAATLRKAMFEKGLFLSLAKANISLNWHFKQNKEIKFNIFRNLLRLTVREVS